MEDCTVLSVEPRSDDASDPDRGADGLGPECALILGEWDFEEITIDGICGVY